MSAVVIAACFLKLTLAKDSYWGTGFAYVERTHIEAVMPNSKGGAMIWMGSKAWMPVQETQEQVLRAPCAIKLPTEPLGAAP